VLGALGFKTTSAQRDADGRIIHAELTRDEAGRDDRPARPLRSLELIGRSTGRLAPRRGPPPPRSLRERSSDCVALVAPKGG
jgi:hypothetical protein